MQQLLKLTTSMATLCSNVESTDKEQTSSLALLEAWWPAEQASRNMQHFVPFVRGCISMATLVCAHGTSILTNRGASELVAEHIFYALQVRTRTI